MRSFNRYILVGLITLAALAGFAQGQIRVVAQIEDPEDIYVGQDFTLHVIVDGENQPGDVDLGPLANYNPRGAGNPGVSGYKKTWRTPSYGLCYFQLRESIAHVYQY